MDSHSESNPVALAEKALREHAAVWIAARKALDHAVVAGRYLLEAKALVKSGGGKWEAWADEHVSGIAASTRSLYMRLAEHWEELQHAGDVEEMTVTAARDLLKRLRNRTESSKASSNQSDGPTAPERTVAGSTSVEPRTEAEFERVVSIGSPDEPAGEVHELDSEVERVVGVETFSVVERTVRKISANPQIIPPNQRRKYVTYLRSLQAAISEALTKLAGD